ncbi:MAG: L-2-amino-thiazoline-4-carboxylic acid hydrolase [Oscillospiraceae bacterium]|nr:L-2-amino-thiazoline-4-carboxylic acid hydrolase [Oscillospiraceae bacterium]
MVKGFCDADDICYGNMHPKLIWGRTKTIGRGDECCNFLLQYRD